MSSRSENHFPQSRREFLSFLSVGWIALAAASGGILSLIFRYTFPNVNFEPELEFSVGLPENLSLGVNEAWKISHGVWVVKQEGVIYALSTICTHLGCIPNWTPSSLTFECPCHGSGYYSSGINFKGPAPRPLERYEIKTLPSGELVVNKGRVFRQEKGQWSHQSSFVESA